MPVTDPGIGTGVGGFFTSLLNPGLATRVAQHLTPNPSPLAQQGQPNAPGSVDSVGNPVPPPGSNLAPAATTQGDPVNAPNVARLSQPDPSYVADQMRYNRMNQLSDDLNRNIQGIAAGFGTAQQQASKTAALGAGGGVGDSLGSLAGIQKMQDQTIADNEHARFMANAAVFAQSMSQSLGRPVSVQEATEWMNNPDALKMATGAAGSNMTTPDKLKEADAEARDWAAAHPNATPQEIAQHKSDFLAQTAGGLSTVGKQLAEDRRNWMNGHPGASFADMVADKPELADETTYVAVKGEQGKQLAQAGEDKLTAQQSFARVDQSYKQMEDTIDWLNDPKHHDAVMNAIATPAGLTQGVVGAGIAKLSAWGVPYLPANDDVNEARAKIDYLKTQQYADNFTGTKNLRSNTEANKLGASAANVDNINNKPADIQQQLTSLQQRVYRERANTYAAAGKAIPTKYEGLADSAYTDPTSKLYQGGHETLPAAKPEDIADAQAVIAAHPELKQQVIQHFHDKGFNAVALQ